MKNTNNSIIKRKKNKVNTDKVSERTLLNKRIETTEENDRELEDESTETLSNLKKRKKKILKSEETQEPIAQYQKI